MGAVQVGMIKTIFFLILLLLPMNINALLIMNLIQLHLHWRYILEYSLQTRKLNSTGLTVMEISMLISSILIHHIQLTLSIKEKQDNSVAVTERKAKIIN